MLEQHECYRAIKPVNIGPVLAVLDRLPFFHAQHNGNYQGTLACDVVLADKFPPEINAFIEGLELGGKRGRAIIRRLDPRQNIPVHTDEWMPGEINWRRFQIPITSHPDIVMSWPDDGASVHLEPGWLYEVRYDRPHEVVHGADVSRVHLQVDQIDATI